MLDSRLSVSLIGALALVVATLVVTGCERQPATQPTAAPTSPPAAQAGASSGDAYDTSKMDFKPGPAKLSAERHTGAFAEGNALSMDATLKPLAPEPVKEIRLDTTHKIIEIAQGVK